MLLDAERTGNILGYVANERSAQDDKWGHQTHSQYKWLAILGEEFGELARAMLEHPDYGPEALNYDRCWEEGIQVAAVAVAYLEYIQHCRAVKDLIEQENQKYATRQIQVSRSTMSGPPSQSPSSPL